VSRRLVGAPIRNLDAPRLIRGAGGFLDDLRPPGLLHAAFLRSSEAHARIRAVCTDDAQRLSGVRAACDGASPTFAVLGAIRPVVSTPGVFCPARPVLAREVVRFVGEAVAVVVAEDRFLAEDAVRLLKVKYDPLPPVVDAEKALGDAAPWIHPDVPYNCFVDRRIGSGDVDAAFAEADVAIGWTRFETPRNSGVPIETRGVLAVPEDDGQLTIWTSSQVPHRVREVVAGSLGIAESDVQVKLPDVGGGFGTKAQVYPEEVAVAALARSLRAPVKWVECRHEHLQAAGHARQQVVKARLAATRDGRVLAIDARVLADVGAYGVYPFGPALEVQGTAAMIPGRYQLQAYRCRLRAVATNKSPVGPYRGVGLPVSTLVHERLMDLLGRELDLAPEEVRRRNLIPSDALPYSTLTGMRYDSGSFSGCLDQAVQVVDLKRWRRRQREVNTSGGHVRLGIGIGSYVEYTGVGAATYRARGMDSVPGFDVTRLRINRDGSVTLTSSIAEIGQGVQTTLRQLAADGLGLPLEMIRFENTDTSSVSQGTGTFASRGAVLGASTLEPACRALKARILDAASAELDARPDDLEIVDGCVRVRDVPERSITLAELAVSSPEPLDVSELSHGPPATFSNATHAAVVEIDTETGDVRIISYAVAEDCGPLINARIVDGQVQGAVAQGIGGALLERLVYDEGGQLVTGTLADYSLPTASLLPNLEIVHLETPSPLVPGGFKGVGEGGTVAAPAVIANAISDALGVDVNTLPATSELVRTAWSRARSTASGGDSS
jgi:carbon-monoxide dehydrogenase large subunit